MNINKFVFSHVRKWIVALASILVLTTTFVKGDQCDVCNDRCCIGYLADFSGNVLVIDLNAGLVLQTIPTGSGTTGIAYAPTEHKMFVANELAGTVTVIDTDTNVAHDIFNDPGSKPNGVTLAPDRRHMWVTLSSKNLSGPNGDSAFGALAKFDIHTEALLQLISLDEPYGFPLDIQFSRNRIYVVEHFEENPTLGGDIAVLDGVTGAILNHFPVGNGTLPASIAPTPDGRTLYISGEGASRVLALDADTGASFAIPTDFGPIKLCITRNGKYVWSTNFGGSSVSKIDTDTNAVVADIAVPGSPFLGTLSPDENTFYCGNFFDATIAVIDTNVNMIQRIFSIGTPGVTLPVELAIVQRQPVQP